MTSASFRNWSRRFTKTLFLSLVAGTALFPAGRAQTARALPPQASDVRVRFEPLPIRQVRLDGEMDRRIRALFSSNLALLDWDADFIEPYLRQDWPDGADACHKNAALYVGIGKCVSSLVRLAEYTGDPQAAALKESIIKKLLSQQQADGYLGTFVPGHRITDYWDLHDMVYLVLALTEDFRYCGSSTSLAAARRIADYVMHNCPADSLPRFGRLNTERAFLALAAATGEAKYADYVVEGAGLRRWRDPVGGHTYFFMNLCLAQLDAYRRIGDTGLLEQSHKVVDTLTRGNALLIHGTSSLGEVFHSEQVGTGSTAETCVSAYLLRLMHHLMQIEGDPFCGDIMERDILNGLFAAQSPDGRRLRYFTPFEGARHYFYMDGYCCPGNLRRAISELPEMAAYRNDTGLLVNLYGPSTITTSFDSISLALHQRTDYPNSGRVLIEVEASEPVTFSLRLRIPRWCRIPRVSVAGKVVAGPTPGTLLTIERRWRNRDTVECTFPMDIRLVRGRARQSGTAAVMRGPVLFCLNPSRQEASNPLFRGFTQATEQRRQLSLRLAEVRARLACAQGAPIPLADLVTGGREFRIDMRTGLPTVLTAHRYSVEPNRFAAAANPYVNGVCVPDGGPGGRGPTPISTTGLSVPSLRKTTGITWDFLSAGPSALQAVSTAGGIDYATAPHSMLALSGNKTLTLDLDSIRTLIHGELSAFTAVVGFGGGENTEPRSLVSFYVDGQAALENIRIGRTPVPVRVDLAPRSRFLTFMVTDSPQDISIAQLADAGPLGYDFVFLGDPALVPVHATGEMGTLEKEAERLGEEVKRTTTNPLPFATQAELVKGLTLDVTSISGPYPDDTIRPDGQCLRVRAWSPGRTRTTPPDLSLELTEFTDPCGEATYFRVSDESVWVEDELVVVK